MAKLKSNLGKIAESAQPKAAKVLEDTVMFALNLVRIFAPVDTGRLRDSYEAKQVDALNWIIGTTVYYSIFQEFGTSRMSAQPHLMPSILMAEQFFKQRFKDEFTR